MTGGSDVLVLGGTGWLGPELITSYLAAGYSVTSLTRRESGSLPDGARAALGDRTKADGYDAVRDQRWDVVVDTTWQPGMARSAVDALADCAGQWMYVSSNGAYRDLDGPGPADDVGSLVEPLDDDQAESDQYRNAKAACEAAVRDARGDDCLIARSGLLCGPGDASERFGYWVGRFALAGDEPVLVPEQSDAELQMIDVRDTADWFASAAQNGLRGTYDVVGPRYTLRELIDVSLRVANFSGEATWPASRHWRSSRTRTNAALRHRGGARDRPVHRQPAPVPAAETRSRDGPTAVTGGYRIPGSPRTGA